MEPNCQWPTTKLAITKGTQQTSTRRSATARLRKYRFVTAFVAPSFRITLKHKNTGTCFVLLKLVDWPTHSHAVSNPTQVVLLELVALPKHGCFSENRLFCQNWLTG